MFALGNSSDDSSEDSAHSSDEIPDNREYEVIQNRKGRFSLPFFWFVIHFSDMAIDQFQ
jgi:hypothetical protein